VTSGVDNVARLGQRLLATDLRADERAFVEGTHEVLVEIADVVAAHRLALDELWVRVESITPSS
jgi:hypothetical protein